MKEKLKKLLTAAIVPVMMLSVFNVPCMGASAEKIPDTWTDFVPTARIYASSVYADNSTKPKTVSNLYDGDKETDWAGLSESSSVNKLVIDLGSSTDIKLIEFVAARMSSFRKAFTVYLSNDNELLEKEAVYESDGGTQGTTYKIIPADVAALSGNKYRYVIFEGNVAGEKIGLAELKIYADANDATTNDNSLINISALNSSGVASTAYAGQSPNRATDMNASTEFVTAQGHYNKEEYFFIDLGKAKKLDSLSLIMGTSNGRGKVKNNGSDEYVVTAENLRTDFDIVARKDNNFTSESGEDILVDYQGTLGPDTGDSSGLCIFEIPDEYKNMEYRYIGIRKKPTEANCNVGQICINEINVYAKAVDYPYSFDKIEAVYNKDAGNVAVSTVARTIEDKPYKFVIAGYDDSGALLEVKIADLKKQSETLRNEKGSEVQGIDYASSIAKTIMLDKHLNIAYAKVMLLTGFDKFAPMTRCTEIELNPEYKAQLLCSLVLNYMKADFETVNVVTYSGSGSPKVYYDYQPDVVVDWDAADGASGYTFTVSTNSDCSDGKVYTTDTNSAVLNNLYVGEEYFWKVISDNGFERTGSFKTQEYAPRWITTETVSNVRDLGGWKTDSGKRVKQGLMYRGAEFSDDDGKNSYLRGGASRLSDNDLDLFVNKLGIKTEFDFRGSENADRTTSILGSGVAYYDKPIAFNDSITEQYTGLLKDILTVMADIDNYPIYFHCVGGNDRTGRMAYLVNGLLGVPKEDLIRDWELSSFTYNSIRRRNDSSYWASFNSFAEYVDSFSGDTLSEKIENLMTGTIGLTRAQVDSIKSIMLED